MKDMRKHWEKGQNYTERLPIQGFALHGDIRDYDITIVIVQLLYCYSTV